MPSSDVSVTMTPSVVGLAPRAKRHFGSSLRITHGASSTRAILIAASVEPVKGAGVGVEDLVDHLLVDRGIVLQEPERLDLRRRIGMAVIGTDDDVVLAAMLEDVGQIIRTLTGDIHAVRL